MEKEDSIQIEFTDEELECGVETPETQGVVEDVKETEVESKDSEESNGSTDDDKAKNDEAGESTDSPADNEAPEENVVAKTDAELAVIHGVSEEEIKYAKNMGWSPKEKFHGNPTDWKGPKEFIDIAEQSAPVLRDRLREMSKKVTEMQKAFPTILDMQKRELQNRVDSLTSSNEQLQKELEEAHLLADSKKAADLTEKIFENKLKIALTEEEKKHVGDEKKEDNQQTIVPDNIDVEKERAWREVIFPKLTLEQREIYNDAVKFVTSPINADKTTDERIAYIESKIFGRQSRPVAAAVARPSVSDVTSSKPTTNEYEGWDSLSKEEKDIATSMLKDTDWFINRETTGKAQWNEFKKQFSKK